MPSISDIEAAFAGRFAGASLTLLDGGVKAVPVFIDMPDPEEFPERVFPSISVVFAGMTPNRLLSGEEYVEGEQTVSVDSGVTPPLATVRPPGVWKEILLTASSWVKDDAAADRTLIEWMEMRFRGRDALTVGAASYEITNVNFNKVDEPGQDTVIYRKVWTYRVTAYLERIDIDDTIEQVTEVRLLSGVVKTGVVRLQEDQGRAELMGAARLPAGVFRYSRVPLNAQGQPVQAVDAVVFTHRHIGFDEADFWFLS